MSDKQPGETKQIQRTRGSTSTDLRTWSRSRCLLTHFTICCHLIIGDVFIMINRHVKTNSEIVHVSCVSKDLLISFWDSFVVMIRTQLLVPNWMMSMVFTMWGAQLASLNVVFKDGAIHKPGVCSLSRWTVIDRFPKGYNNFCMS